MHVIKNCCPIISLVTLVHVYSTTCIDSVYINLMYVLHITEGEHNEVHVYIYMYLHTIG